MKTKILFLSFLLVFFQFGISYANHYNLMVASSVLKKHNIDVAKMSNSDFQVHQYTRQSNDKSQDAHSAAQGLNGYLIASIIVGTLGTMSFIHYIWQRNTLIKNKRKIEDVKNIGSLTETSKAAVATEIKATEKRMTIDVGMIGASVILAGVGIAKLLKTDHKNHIPKVINTSTVLLKNNYPYFLRYDAQNSHCQNDSGQVIQGNDIYPAPAPLNIDTNNSSSNAVALNANAGKITPANTAPTAITGKVKANGKLSPALIRDIKKNAYSIGAVMQAGKNGINCTLAYFADKGAGSTAYANEIKVLVNQSPSRLGKAGQLQVHVLPLGDLKGTPVYIQQPQAEPQTPQMLQQVTHPLKSAIQPFAKQKQDDANQDKSKAGVAVISLSPNAN